MSNKTTDNKREEFRRHLLSLQMRLGDVRGALDFLKEIDKRKIEFPGKHLKIVKFVVLHFLINNIHALFDNKRNRNSLLRLSEDFEKQFRHNFFDEFKISVEQFKEKHCRDLERIENNRNLTSAHLASAKNRELGFNEQTMKTITTLFGNATGAKKVSEELQHISAHDIYEMRIFRELGTLSNNLNELHIKSYSIREKEEKGP